MREILIFGVMTFILVLGLAAAMVANSYYEVGIASWYGPGFHGKRTASGEIYDMYGISAAHKTLPSGRSSRSSI
jgi:rare lipoprotein A (peptidoglycan hydrolase)